MSTVTERARSLYGAHWRKNYLYDLPDWDQLPKDAQRHWHDRAREAIATEVFKGITPKLMDDRKEYAHSDLMRMYHLDKATANILHRLIKEA